MWANYEFKTDKPYRELQAILLEFNNFILTYHNTEKYKISRDQQMKYLIEEFKHNMDKLVLGINISKFPLRVQLLYQSIDAERQKRFVKLFPDNYRHILPQMSGPAARLYLALKVYVRTHGSEAGTSFVSRERLASDLRVSIKWVEKYIRELKDLGLLQNFGPKGSRKNDWKVY